MTILLQTLPFLVKLDKGILAVVHACLHPSDSFCVPLLPKHGLEDRERVAQVRDCVVRAGDIVIISLPGIVVGQ